jgi:hypothetical protein
VDSGLVAVLTGSGGAAAALGAVLVCFLSGLIFPKQVVADLKAENSELKQALESQRDRADAAVAAAQASKDVMSALQAGILIARQQEPEKQLPGGPGP